MPKKQIVSGKKGKSSTLSTDHVTRPPVPDLIQTKLTHVAMKVRKSVAEGYKVKQTIFPTNDPPQTVATTPLSETKSLLKRSRDDEEDGEEQVSSTPRLVVTSSFNSFTSEDDWEEPEWLLPKEVVCADVVMKEAN